MLLAPRHLPALVLHPTGPHVPWRPGRSDYALDQFVANPDGRLPDGDKDAKHVRDIFYR
jgi:cytochrome c peroxidase